MTLHVHGLVHPSTFACRLSKRSRTLTSRLQMYRWPQCPHSVMHCTASMPANCPTDRNCHLTNAQPQTAASAPQPPTAAVTAPIIASAALQPSCQYSCQSCTTPHPPNRRPQQCQCPTLVQHRLVMCQPNRRPQQRQ